MCFTCEPYSDLVSALMEVSICTKLKSLELILWSVHMCNKDGTHSSHQSASDLSAMCFLKNYFQSTQFNFYWSECFWFWAYKGRARTQSPTNKNCAPESPTFGAIAKVSPTGVQWKGLTLGEPPHGSRYLLCQVSMPIWCSNPHYKAGV